MTDEQFATMEEQLREALENAGLSHQELARRSGVSQPIISRFIRGERSLTLPIASKLCHALGLKLITTNADQPEGNPAAEVKPSKPRKRKK